VDGAPVARGDAVRVRCAPPASRFRTPPESVEVSLELLERVAVHEGWAGPRAEQPLSFEQAETVVARRVTTPGEEVVLEVPRDLPYGHAPRVPIVCGGGGSPCAPRATTRCSPPCRTVTPAVAAGS
jgi:hypothetical protein